MKLELQQKLFKDCPELFKFHNHEGPPYWPIKFGIDTEDGWNDIVINLCYELESILKTLPKNEESILGCVQIKEKFGGLRFYMSGYDIDNKVENLIIEAEHKCWKICERCGHEGKLVSTRRKWLLTLCPQCEEKVNS